VIEDRRVPEVGSTGPGRDGDRAAGAGAGGFTAVSEADFSLRGLCNLGRLASCLRVLGSGFFFGEGRTSCLPRVDVGRGSGYCCGTLRFRIVHQTNATINANTNNTPNTIPTIGPVPKLTGIAGGVPGGVSGIDASLGGGGGGDAITPGRLGVARRLQVAHWPRGVETAAPEWHATEHSTNIKFRCIARGASFATPYCGKKVLLFF